MMASSRFQWPQRERSMLVIWLFAGLIQFMLLLSLPAAAEKRVALVIGNATYKFADELANTKTDAADMSAALKSLGFQVVEGIDLDKAGMDRKVQEFSEALTGADAGVFYYTGHGLQVANVNYLMPIDAKLENSGALDFELLRLDLIQRVMERETPSNILFLDACRDNPLARGLARAMGTRSAQIGRGLAAAKSGAGTLISFATQPGAVTIDTQGRNSPYTGALVKQITGAGLHLNDLLIAVRNEVVQATARKQVPWEHSALTGLFYFKAPAASAVPVPNATPNAPSLSAAAPPPTPAATQEWATLDKTNPAQLENFLRRYGLSSLGTYARQRLNALEREKEVRTETERKTQEAALKAQQDKDKSEVEAARQRQENAALLQRAYAVAIGTTASAGPQVTGELSSSLRNLQAGDDIYQFEIIETGGDGSVEFRLNDQTKIAVGAKSRLAFERFDDGATGSGTIVINLVKGSLRFMTGDSDKEAYRIRIPSASVTVRGTIFDLNVQDDESAMVLLIDGALAACNDRGECGDLNVPGKLLQISTTGDVGKPVTWAKLPENGRPQFAEVFPFVVTAPKIIPSLGLSEDEIVLGRLPGASAKADTGDGDDRSSAKRPRSQTKPNAKEAARPARKAASSSNRGSRPSRSGRGGGDPKFGSSAWWENQKRQAGVD